MRIPLSKNAAIRIQIDQCGLLLVLKTAIPAASNFAFSMQRDANRVRVRLLDKPQ